MHVLAAPPRDQGVEARSRLAAGVHRNGDGVIAIDRGRPGGINATRAGAARKTSRCCK